MIIDADCHVSSQKFDPTAILASELVDRMDLAGVDRALPPAFARLHRRWRTPYVSLLLMGVLASVFILASLANSTVKSAYLLLTQTTLILFFIPYLYIFAAYLQLRRRRTAGTLLTGLLGLASVAFSIVLGFVVPGDEAHPGVYRLKVVGGVVVFMGIGFWLSRRSVRGPTATPASAP